jgi:hypothetical protein
MLAPPGLSGATFIGPAGEQRRRALAAFLHARVVGIPGDGHAARHHDHGDEDRHDQRARPADRPARLLIQLVERTQLLAQRIAATDHRSSSTG